MKNIKIFLPVIIIVTAGIAFFAGMKYQQSQRGAFNRQFTGNQTQNRNRAGSSMTVGDIINMDDKSITVKLQDDSTKIVLLTGQVSINKEATGSKSDLKVGDRVGVFGANNPDGSIIAQSLQINPQLRMNPRNPQ